MFAFLSPYKLLIEAIAVAALIAGIAYGIHRFLAAEQNIGYQRAVAEYTAKQLLAEQAARAKEALYAKQLEDAQNAATQRDQINTNLAAASAATSASLRDTISTIRNGLPAATADAARKTASAFAAVFGDCQGNLVRMAKAADGHLSDNQTLRESWPK